MINACRQYLIDKLKASGIKSKIHTSQKSLENTKENHIGAVIFESDKFSRSGAKKYYSTEDDQKRKRVKIFNRNVSFVITIGEYDELKCETMFETLMTQLDNGLVVDGNWVAITPDDADWIDKEDSVLNAKIAVQLRVIFEGGIYKDIALKPLEDVDVAIDRE